MLLELQSGEGNPPSLSREVLRRHEGVPKPLFKRLNQIEKKKQTYYNIGAKGR